MSMPATGASSQRSCAPSSASPRAMDVMRACVASHWMRRRGAEGSSSPVIGSVLNMGRALKSGFDGDIDVIGASVDAAEELGLADLPRAVRDADADISIARHA